LEWTMQWSRVKHLVEQRFAPSIRSRMSLHQARYRYTRGEVGRVWLTIDGREVASFDTASYVAKCAALGADIREARGLRPFGVAGQHPEYLEADAEAEAILYRAGEYDDYRAVADLEASLSMPVETALASPSPLLRALAVADVRVGKRRLHALGSNASEHPLVLTILRLRCAAEQVDFGSSAG
jgi:hypothetical protein